MLWLILGVSLGAFVVLTLIALSAVVVPDDPWWRDE